MPTHLEIGQVPTTVDSLKRPVSQNSTTSVAKTQLRKGTERERERERETEKKMKLDDRLLIKAVVS